MLTGDVQKEKYVYRCTSHRDKCDLPRFREEDIADRLGEPLKGLQVPPEIVSQIVATLREDQKKAQGKVSAEQTRLESRLSAIRNRMDVAYIDKLDGKIPEDFWDRKMSEWRVEEQQVKWRSTDSERPKPSTDPSKRSKCSNLRIRLIICTLRKMPPKKQICSESSVRTFQWTL
jgi:chorismate mutase